MFDELKDSIELMSTKLEFNAENTPFIDSRKQFIAKLLNLIFLMTELWI